MKAERNSPFQPARTVAPVAYAHRVEAGGRLGGVLFLFNRRAGMC